PMPEEPESSVADLLAAGRLGTAIERLETKVRHRPDDFDAWLMLAEAHGRYCCNLERARDIVRRIEMNAAFNPRQIREARAKLQEWRERQPNSSVTVG
ncbi:MAG: tetratricopeptide repeat protein, partial [Limisphaerales bacterium]